MRPHVIVNCAASIDGKIALPSRRQTAISSRDDFARVHKLRASCDAILVGIGTVLADDPSLVVKEEYSKVAKNPLRVVLDSNGRTPDDAKVLDGRAETIIVTSVECAKTWKGADVLRFGNGCVDLQQTLEALRRRKVGRLMVEGGGTIIWAFLKGGLVDELKVFVGSMVIGGAGPTIADGDGATSLDETIKMRLVSTAPMEGGVLMEYERA